MNYLRKAPGLSAGMSPVLTHSTRDHSSSPTWHPPPGLQVPPDPGLGHHVGAAVESAGHHAAGVEADRRLVTVSRD